MEERETWAAKLADWLRPVLERDFDGHVYQENTPHYERSDARNDGCEFSSIQ